MVRGASKPIRLTLHHIAGAAIAAAVAMPLLVSSPTARAQPVDTTASVLKVVDGDTIDIRDDVRGRLRVRVLGIDTPETKKPDYTVGCWRPEATEFAQSTMVGQRVITC
jgi:micrococcal nuclease